MLADNHNKTVIKPIFNLQGQCNLGEQEISQMGVIHGDNFKKRWRVETLNAMFVSKNSYKLGYDGAVISLNSQIIGFIISQNSIDDGEIISIAIANNHKKNGYAKQLLKAEIIRLKTLNVAQYLLEVDIQNIAAISLYKGFGFKQIGVRKNYYKHKTGKATNALVFSLNIKN